MTPDNRKKAEAVFHRLVSLPAAQREAELESACGDSPEIRAEVEALLRYNSALGEGTEDVPLQPHADADTGTLDLRSSPESLPGRAPRTGKDSTIGSAAASDFGHGRFLPGSVVHERYRIVGLLGRGGMGEVYRADDLELGEAVALKFLPESLAENSATLGRFRTEVRLSRQISHPNVCRVHDIGQVDGQWFLSMEYVDGEDLHSLLQRIGRFSSERAVEISRQICLGLGAAHDQGVLHRDLKPANIMVDGRGKVLITDFGLAEFAGEIDANDVRSGTPAYMAPEQLAGREVTERSDIFSLGLILHEVFTGKPVWKAKSIAELVHARQSTPVPTPGGYVDDLAPQVERTIQRCLDPDPGQRPHSAIAVASSLPGGDPLAAALAAGETPSLAVLAQTGDSGGMKPVVAAAMALGTLLAILVSVFLSPPSALERSMSKISSTEMYFRARDLVQKLGFDTEKAPYTEGGYTLESANDDSDHPDQSSKDASRQWYWQRWSPTPLQSSFGLHKSSVDFEDPPRTTPGSAAIRFDAKGKLRLFELIPQLESSEPHFEKSETAQAESRPENDAGLADWTEIFDLAGLDFKTFEQRGPHPSPTRHCDTILTWTGADPEDPTTRLAVDIGLRTGRLILFRFHDLSFTAREPDTPIGFIIMGIVVLLIAALGARQNMLNGRVDRRGAFRLSILVFFSHLLVDTLLGPALSNRDITSWVQDFFQGTLAGHALFHATVVWLFYVAIEPSVRRLWPSILPSWARLMSGKFTDPLIGRELLAGLCVGGATLILLSAISRIALVRSWPDPQDLQQGSPFDFSDLGHVVALLVTTLSAAVFLSIGQLMIILFFRMSLRKTWLAVTVYLCIAAVIPIVMQGFSWSLLASEILWAGASAFVLLRFGLVALISWRFLVHTSMATPISADLGAWWTTSFYISLLILVTLLLAAYRIAVAGQSLLGPREA